jgi:hypothetical protein
MQASTYGEMNLPKELSKGFTTTDDKIINGRIKSGRWENLTVAKNTYYPDMVNSYGYLRSAWNLNPSPYISRFPLNFSSNSVSFVFPTCSGYYNILQYDDMMDFFEESAFPPHGSTHTLFAGMYGCDALDTM